MSKYLIAMAIAVAFGSSPAHSEEYELQARLITTLYTHATSPCVFFQLEGIPSTTWFTIEKTNKESYAILLAARLTERPLKRVYSDGASLCGSTRAMVIEL